MRRFLGRLIRALALLVVLLLIVLVGPVLYVETACRGSGTEPERTPLITDPAHRRAEANSYLTYPEWHIVYAYEGLAEVLKTGDEHAFGYVQSVLGFWSSACKLNQLAQTRGGADFATRATIHVIGASFTLEMGAKALYEETLGRLFAVLRGPQKTAQDRFAAAMAADYAAFLQQTPWYRYDFTGAAAKLDALPATEGLRAAERRFALGLEWRAKAAYAQVIAGAVEATGAAALTIRSVVAGLGQAELEAIEGVRIVGREANAITIETPRYRAFTKILGTIAARGGTVREIAGNDDILVTATATRRPMLDGLAGVTVITDVARDGFGDRRWLIDVKVAALAEFLRVAPRYGLSVEHVYDY